MGTVVEYIALVLAVSICEAPTGANGKITVVA